MVFFGHPSGYSLAVLAGLLERNLRPCAVVQHGRPPPRSPIPVFPAADTPAGLASQHGIDVLWVNDPNPASLALALSELEAGLFLVACYPRRLPGEVFRLAQRACLNLHPSLLPGYRGPAPVFWQLQDGERNTGISLHHVTDRLDAGPLVAQRRVPLPPGVTLHQAETLLAHAGAALVADTLRQYPEGSFPAIPQDEARASYQPMAPAADR